MRPPLRVRDFSLGIILAFAVVAAIPTKYPIHLAASGCTAYTTVPGLGRWIVSKGEVAIAKVVTKNAPTDSITWLSSNPSILEIKPLGRDSTGTLTLEVHAKDFGDAMLYTYCGKSRWPSFYDVHVTPFAREFQ